jgi:hypothetical protein
MPRKTKSHKIRANGAKAIAVMVADDRLQDIHKLAEDLSAEGMTVQRVLPVTGMITGIVEAETMPQLRNVKGVLSVEEELTAGPSDASANE